MRRFNELIEAEVKSIAFEIAALGHRGLKTGDRATQYKLKTMSGDYTGVQLACLMYVGFHLVAPQHDVGFDLAKKYEATKGMTEWSPE